MNKVGTFRNIEEAREFFKGDRFAAANGMTIDEMFDDGCLCSMAVREDHRNAIGGIMGGVIYTLADFAYAVCANNDHMATVALDASVRFLRMSKGTRLFARSKTVKTGKTTDVVSIMVTDDQGKEIALVTITGYKL